MMDVPARPPSPDGPDSIASDRTDASDPHLLVERDGPVLRVTINRPASRNALSRATLADLGAVFSEHAADRALRLAVISGAGERSFAAGGDLKDFASIRTEAEVREMSNGAKAVLQAVRDFPVPVIAALNGDALGGGSELAIACDMRVAAAHVRIGFIQGRLNVCTAWGGGHDLIRLIGPANALRVLSRSEMLDAASAHAAGLVDCIAEDGESLDAAVARFAAPILSQAPQVLRAFKALTHADKNEGRGPRDRLETERFAETWVHEDHWTAVERLLTRKG